MPVALLGLFAATLVHAAVEQIILAVCNELVHRAGDGPGGAPEVSVIAILGGTERQAGCSAFYMTIASESNTRRECPA